MTQISCKNVAIHYNGVPVVKNVSFSIEKGDHISIIGENGSGKSTIVKSMLGLVPIQAGKITFENGLTKNQIGYLPQQTLVQRDFPASVLEIVMSGFLSDKKFFGFYNSTHKKQAFQNMKKLGIDNIKSKCYRELSGGQQQRVLLARALCAAKSMIILDEPVSGLDPAATTQFYSLVNDLSKEKDLTVVMISHDMKFSMANANKILHMKLGDSFYGKIDEYLKSETYKKFLGESQL